MSQASYTPDVSDNDAAALAFFNNVFAAIASNNAGAAEPSETYPYMIWADTSGSNVGWKVRNAANNGWGDLFKIATQAVAEAGTNNTDFMTALAVKQAIDKQAAPVVPALTLLHEANTGSAGNSAVHTYNSVAIGTPSLTRRLIIVAGAGSSNSGAGNQVNSVTVGGIAANKLEGTTNVRSTVSVWELYYPEGGSTATVVASFGASCASGHIAVFEMVSDKPVVSATQKTRFATGASPTSNTLSLAASFPDNALIFSAYLTSANVGIVWTGDLTEISEDSHAVSGTLSCAYATSDGTAPTATGTGTSGGWPVLPPARSGSGRGISPAMAGRQRPLRKAASNFRKTCLKPPMNCRFSPRSWRL